MFFRERRVAAPIVALLAIAAFALAGRAAEPRFFPDDPIRVDDDMAMDAGAALPVEGPTAATPVSEAPTAEGVVPDDVPAEDAAPDDEVAATGRRARSPASSANRSRASAAS